MFICTNCHHTFFKWNGQCENCKLWNTLVEDKTEIRNPKNENRKSVFGNRKSKAQNSTVAKPIRLDQIKNNQSKRSDAYTTGIQEFDNTLGGRLIQGQVILFAGEPGIGKSTLTLQIADSFSKQKLNVLYICGEESPIQIKTRSDRIKLKLENVEFLPETNVDSIVKYLASNSDNIDFLIVDSIQTLYSPNILSSAGSVSQISESSNEIINVAKGFGITTMIIGHVTKSGDIAGPKILEHMVDTVLYFEGEKRLELRMLRVEKNRFGSTDEVGIFKMTQNGLEEILDTKELFDQSKPQNSGSIYALIMEGTRPVVVEVQALATKTYFSNPRRTTSGFDLNRLFILLAVIDKKLKLQTGDYDIYVNITGGIKVTDAALDLAVIGAVISSIKDKIINKESIFFGEVGLTGEIRKVFMEEKRIKEAKRLGFNKIFSAKEYRNISELAY